MNSREKRSLLSLYDPCRLCPRHCSVDRLSGQKGFCGEAARLRVAHIEAHFGEEPFFTGVNGSGTVFFSGCSLGCRYCQNYQISRKGMGKSTSVLAVAQRILDLWAVQSIHNVNLVTADHFLPHIIALVHELRERGATLPVIYNSSGYQRPESLRLLEPFVDIYLPDFKYGDAKLAENLSRAGDYPAKALEAIEEMLRQKGFLEVCKDHQDFSRGSSPRIAQKGVLVRHLVLPGQTRNSMDALTMLFIEFGADLPLSLMSQYAPAGNDLPDELGRELWPEEFRQVLEHAMGLGFRRILYQPLIPGLRGRGDRPFVPDFRRKRPFAGNIKASCSRGKRGPFFQEAQGKDFSLKTNPSPGPGTLAKTSTDTA
ncbi:MAG: radical SAM protein [bacterium]